MTAIPICIELAMIADILGELGEEIERLGVSLGMDPAVSGQHMTTLQAIALIAQKQRGLATFLRAECPISAAAAIELEELRSRLGLHHKAA